MSTSRYEDAMVYRVRARDGRRVLALYLNEADAYPQDFDYEPHRVVVGDRLDVIAEEVYDDPTLWWVIARANPEILDPEVLPVGSLIRIPLG